MAAKLRITLLRSTVGTNQSARGTVRALGLHRIGETVEVADNPATRGMVRAVNYLVTAEEVAEAGAPARGKAASSES